MRHIKRKDSVWRPKGQVSIYQLLDGKKILLNAEHNIFVDQGRDWLAALVSGNSVFGLAHPQIIAYMGFGTGGALQDVPAERTTQTENASVIILDSTATYSPGPVGAIPLSTTGEDLRKLGTGTLTGSIGSPFTANNESVLFTAVLSTSDLTYPSGPTGVPLSEAGLFILGKADVGSVDIDSASPPGGTTPRLVAYQQFRTITKTNEISLEFDWEIRF
jgi:hypothetical protein